MQNFIIKTHQKKAIYNQPHLFILNKGMNSGKPQKEPFTNSFVVIFDSEQDCENLYFVAYSLWKTKFWYQHLVGSVIPFLRLNDFKKEFFVKSKMMMEEHEAHIKHIAALKLLEQKKNNFTKTLTLSTICEELFYIATAIDNLFINPYNQSYEPFFIISNRQLEVKSIKSFLWCI